MLDVTITGNAMQMAIVTLRPDQVLFAEAGKFLFSSGDVTMETKLSQPSAGGPQPQEEERGGLGGFLRGAVDAGKRMMAGESLAFTHFRTGGGDGMVAVGGVLPGEMQVIELDGTRSWFTEKDAFVAAEAGVGFDIAFSGLRQGLRGGEGFVLERFSGTGSLIIAGAGNFVELNPADHGGTIKVDTGCIVAWDDAITYDVQRIGRASKQGMMTAMFGGEGFTLATLSGNGKVILQSMSTDGLATAIAKSEPMRDTFAQKSDIERN